MTFLEIDVTRFHRRFGFPVNQSPADDATIKARIDLTAEESHELLTALQALRNNPADPELLKAVALECVDLVFVCIGTMVALKLPFRPNWLNVLNANMAKRPNGRLKPTKGAGWRKPAGVLR